MSKSVKEKRKRLGKRTVVKYKKAKKGLKSCALCEKKLHGTLSGKKAGKASKSEGRPSRIFGGNLCGKCTANIMAEAVKVKLGVKELSDVKLSLRNYIQTANARIK